MTMHLFGTVLTAKAVAANNRGENEGTVSTLQKIIRNGDIFTTVSAEAMRYAMREVWQIEDEESLNRRITGTGLDWRDRDFAEPNKYLDDDVLGFMHAREETRSRRGALEITRAVSTIPWAGTLSSNFASPRSNPGLNNADPIPYQVEIHDTRYQYSFAMTPDYLGKDGALRTEKTLRAIQNLRRVAGNHARFLFDFSPEVVVLRWCPDPAPRMLLCFDEDDRGNISLKRLAARLKGDEKDIEPSEIVIGTVLDNIRGLDEIRNLDVKTHEGIKAAVSEAISKVKLSLGEDQVEEAIPKVGRAKKATPKK
jgi:CRISPR-associated protein Cst2